MPLLPLISWGSWLQATGIESFNRMQKGNFYKNTGDSYELWETKWRGLENGCDAAASATRKQRSQQSSYLRRGPETDTSGFQLVLCLYFMG